MAKRNKGNKAAVAVEAVDAVVDSGVESPEANEKLASFAKAKNAADAKKADAKVAATKASKTGKDGLPKLPSLPRGAGKPKAEKPCECGCGLMTKSRFAPGHDSRLKGWAIRIARKQVKLEDITGKYECSQGEQDAVEAHVKQLKKDGKWEALKVPTAPVKKAQATVPATEADEE